MFPEVEKLSFDGVIDRAAIKSRYDAVSPFLDERSRRLMVAGEAATAGRGGIAAVSAATGAARSTIQRGLAGLRGEDLPMDRMRRAGGGRPRAVDTQPGLLEALGELVQSAIRKLPCSGSARANGTPR